MILFTFFLFSSLQPLLQTFAALRRAPRASSKPAALGPPSTSIVVIGGTGTLGSELTKALSSSTHQVYCSYRDKFKADNLLLETITSQKNNDNRPKLFEFDFQSSQSLDIPGFGRCSNSDEQILINCGGVCIHGHSSAILSNTLKVNTIGPIDLAKRVLTSGKGNNAPPSGNGKKTASELKKKTIINITSGDGERVYINSDIINELDQTTSMEDLERYIQHLEMTYDPNMEYAFGSSPMYSLSKCLLNKATCLLHTEFRSEARVLACCPGNFLSPMTTDEELDSASESNLGEVAGHVCALALDYKAYPGGQFYRYGDVIDW